MVWTNLVLASADPGGWVRNLILLRTEGENSCWKAFQGHLPSAYALILALKARQKFSAMNVSSSVPVNKGCDSRSGLGGIRTESMPLQTPMTSAAILSPKWSPAAMLPVTATGGFHSGSKAIMLMGSGKGIRRPTSLYGQRLAAGVGPVPVVKSPKIGRVQSGKMWSSSAILTIYEAVSLASSSMSCRKPTRW